MAGPGSSRPWRSLVLLWLLLALLPLRGWAGAVMHLPGAAAHDASIVSPCHGAGADARDHATPADATVHADAACALCDLCHGTVALPVPPLQPAGEAAAQRPPTATTGAPPDAIAAALYRPPRR